MICYGVNVVCVVIWEYAQAKQEFADRKTENRPQNISCLHLLFLHDRLHPFPTIHGLNVCQNENVIVHSDVKPLVPLENAGYIR
mgnify:CR=1 FL=1